MADTDAATVEHFIAKWNGVTASELSTSQAFCLDLCALLGVDAPHATAEQDYMFERPDDLPPWRWQQQRRPHRPVSARRVRAGVEEAQGRRAHQAVSTKPCCVRIRRRRTTRARCPPSEGRPPFVLVVDVGHRIELYLRVQPQRRHLRAVPGSAQPPHRAGRPAQPGHPRTPAPHLAGPAGARPQPRVRPRHPRASPRKLAELGQVAGTQRPPRRKRSRSS